MKNARRILLAEDDLTSRRMLQSILTRWGFEVVAAGDGNEAWQALNEPDHPQLAVLDWMMPGMDGLEVVHRLRERNTSEPPYVIILTSRDEKKFIAEALNAGADDYITKPYNNDELLARIGVGLRVTSLQSALAGRVEDLDRANTTIAQMAATDELTGLANRRSFNERLAAEISATRRHSSHLALIMADLDRFKTVNDSFGHDAGDRVLKGFADLMREHARQEDLSARWGGEEFVILLPHTTAAGGERLAERLRAAFAQEPCEGVDLPLSASFGVAQLLEGETADRLIKRADNALRQAKEAGRNRVVVASGESLSLSSESRPDHDPSRNMVILIVDDDPTTRQVLAGILQRVGFQTESAVDGRESLSLAKTLRPDLVLLDVNLPDTDGFAVCGEIKRTPDIADTPVIFISANEDVTVKVRGFEAGGVDYLTKPLAGKEVIARVRTHLRLKHAYDTLARVQSEQVERFAATQKMILPTPATMPEARFAVCLKQFHGAGGDFYDVIRVGDLLVDYIVADVSGHNLETSLWTTAMKTLLHEHSRPLFEPVDILRTINRSLCRVLPEGLFFTVIYARLNRQSGRLTLVNGGHPPAIRLPSGRPPGVIRQTGEVLGAFPDADFETTEVSLRQGDRFLLYTDGIIEKEGGQEGGIARLLEVCEAHGRLSLDSMVEAVTADMLAWTATGDDIVLLGVEV